MDIQYQGLLALVKSSITGEACQLPPEFSLDGAVALAGKHEIIPMLCEGAAHCGISRDKLQPLMKAYYAYTIAEVRQADALKKLLRCFDEHEIDYLPVKGSHLKSLYPKPEMRIMGDADILIRMPQYEKIRPLMVSLDFEEKYESDHELVWQKPALMVELHKRLIPSYNSDYYRYFGDGWRLAVPDTGTRYTMRPEDEFIYVFTHFSKHFRDGGIGCRHVVDLWVFRRAFPDLDEAYICRELKKLQLEEFYANICRLLQVWFEDAPADPRTEFITKFIFDSGAFGQQETRQTAAALRNAAQAGSVSAGKRAAMRRALFPDSLTMAQRYPMLKKAPWLTPVFWPVKWTTALLFRRDHIQSQQQRISDVSEEEVETLQQAFRLVGLGFHFEE